MNATKTCLTELKRLVKDAKANLYRRIELAATVLADLDWIAREHGGSELKAHDALQSEFFPDLGGYLSLGKLLQMYRKVGKPQWEECRYDIAAVEVVYDEQHQTTTAEERGSRTAWKKIAEERAERIEQLEAYVAKLTSENDRLSAENTDLRNRVARLEGAIDERRALARA
jgi:hypothetical protein